MKLKQYPCVKSVCWIGLSILFLILGDVRQVYGQLSWSSRQLDFRPNVMDETVDAQFEFVNAGNTPVNITDVKTSCGCTTAALDKKTYSPGEKGKISATFHIGDRMGLQQKQVMVATDSPEEPSVQLTIRAFIPELLRIEPRAVVWPQNSEPSIKVIRITTGTDQPVNILGVRTTDDRLFAQLRQVQPGRSYDVSVAVSATQTPLRGTLRIETDYPTARPKVITIPLEVHAPFVPQQNATSAAQSTTAAFPNPPTASFPNTARPFPTTTQPFPTSTQPVKPAGADFPASSVAPSVPPRPGTFAPQPNQPAAGFPAAPSAFPTQAPAQRPALPAPTNSAPAQTPARTVFAPQPQPAVR